MVAAILVALRSKKESPAEIAAAAQVMRDFATPVSVGDKTHLVDVVGTGGDGAHTFNISTASMFVACAAGAKIAKHGHRGVSSKSGSADVLEALGVKLNLSAEAVGRCIEQIGLGFMFAPNHHSAMKHAAPVRRELGVRTLFNLLGPLTNPANAKRQIMGVFSPALTVKLAQVLQQLGSEHVLVVCGADGMDEISFTGDSHVAELKNGQVTEYTINPAQFGLPVHQLASIQIDNAEQSKAMILAVLNGELGAARDIVLLNAGAAIYVAGLADSLAAGIKKAAEVIDQGLALAKLNALQHYAVS
jgi:anthranilate phosphoribosyltransferase